MQPHPGRPAAGEFSAPVTGRATSLEGRATWPRSPPQARRPCGLRPDEERRADRSDT